MEGRWVEGKMIVSVRQTTPWGSHMGGSGVPCTKLPRQYDLVDLQGLRAAEIDEWHFIYTRVRLPGES